MALIKHGAFVANVFTRIADEEALPPGSVIVSLKRWLAERAALTSRDAPVGVRLTADQSPEALGPDVHRLAAIELEFPVFRDGRGYSWARLLRQRMGYKGEIRAVGDVLRDQWLFMSRCGIDAFEVRPGARLEDFRAALNEQTVFYQSAADRRRNVVELRHTVRTPMPRAMAAE